MLNAIVPKFIKDFDKKLLLNQPFWYMVKIHYLLYFSVLMWVLSFMIGAVLPIDITSNNPTGSGDIWIFIFAVLAVILFSIWMYYLTIYNNENHFGKYSKFDDVKFLLVFFIAVNLLLSFSYPMQYVLKNKLGDTFTDKELAEQCNTCNMANKYITSNIEDFQYCGYDVHQEVSYLDLQNDTSKTEAEKYLRDLAKYKNFSSCYFQPLLYNFDFCYLFLPANQKESSPEFNSALYSPFKIESEYLLHRTDKEKLKAITDYFNLVRIYENKNQYYQNKYSPQDYLSNYNHIEKICVANFPEAYNITAEDRASTISYLPVHYINYNIENIYKAKFSFPGFLTDEYLLFVFYFSFFISLFVILFRNNKWQHYLVSVVSFILIGIILGIISAIFQFISFTSLFPTLCLLTWLSAGLVSLFYYFKNDRYYVVGVVATNLFYVCLPVMPFLVSVYCHETFGLFKCIDYAYANVNGSYNAEECIAIQQNYDNLLLYSQIIGIALFVIFALPFYKLYFIKQKALPTYK